MWGWLSDRYCKNYQVLILFLKIRQTTRAFIRFGNAFPCVLLLGLVGIFITINLFGLSQWYWMAIVSRFLTGFLCGNVGVVKTYIGEGLCKFSLYIAKLRIKQIKARPFHIWVLYGEVETF